MTLHLFISQMDGVTNTYHTPYLIDLVNKGSVLIPDLWIPVPERFLLPEQREHLFVPGSQKATVSLVGRWVCARSKEHVKCFKACKINQQKTKLQRF